jgi:branched-chain amino acid transport system permease protein
VQTYTLLAFAIGAACAGVAGALFAGLVQFVEPTPFSLGASFLLYLMVVVGGSGSFFGPALGAAVGVLLPEWLRFAQGWYLVAFGVAVVLLMRWLPGGLISIPDRVRAWRAGAAATRGQG